MVMRWLHAPCIVALVLAALVIGSPLIAARPLAAGVLRVCADPNNLPFSNRRGEGFENRLAELLATTMQRRLEYNWWAQRRGFIRNTLQAGQCDVVMGVPRDFELALTTRPYYRSSYVFVQRRDRGPAVRSLDDQRLRALKIGVGVIGDDYANAPPAHALARRGVVNNVVGFSVYGDYAQDSPPHQLVAAVDHGDIDLAIAWGPLAGFYAQRSSHALLLTPVAPASDGPMRFVFDISVGVRHADRALHDSIERIMEQNQSAVSSLLRQYGVPLLRKSED
jgi:quinoprotein dehydrogenase-associated probable ABC transporter substrate-binding protein